MRFNTPLRYPGGKGKLTNLFKDTIISNGLDGGTYIEPFAGGAGVAINLLLDGTVSKIVINDYDRSVYAFWKSVTERTDEFLDLMMETPITVEEWRLQREVQADKDHADLFELGFSTFFMNRTNRSGVICGGIIGGKNQGSAYKIDARFNKTDLSARIRAIGDMANRIEVTGVDANELLKNGLSKYNTENTLIYIDPPYLEKGSLLYMNHYGRSHHEELAKTIRGLQHKWILSYDEQDFILNLYQGFPTIRFTLTYSAHSIKTGKEVFFTSPGIDVASVQ